MPVFLRPIMAPEAQWIAYGGVVDRDPVRVAARHRAVAGAAICERRSRVETGCSSAFSERDAKERA